MAKFKVTAPDGRKVTLTGDSPPTEKELEDIFAKLPPVKDESSLLGDVAENITGFTQEALNTATFGVSDIVAEAGESLAQSIFGDETTAPEQTPIERREAFREENPKTAIVASIIGGFANPIGQKLGGIIAKAPGTVSAIGRGSAGGAVLGGAQAGGEARGDIQEQVVEAGGGALLGGTVGAVIPGAVAGVKEGAKGIISLLGRFSDKRQGTVALRKIAEALERDGFTPEQALERINKLGPESALIDVGPNSRALGFTAFGTPGKGKDRILQFLKDRQEGVRDPKTGIKKGGQIARIEEHIDEIVPENFFNQRQAIANIDESSQLFKSAFANNQNIESKVIDRILKTPAGKEAFKNAGVTLRNLQTNVSKVDPDLTQLAKEAGVPSTGRGVGRGLKLQFLDQVKKELFDLETLAKTPFGKATEKSRAITNLRRKLVKELDEGDAIKGGDYKRARGLAQDKIANQEALEKGADFMSKAKFGSPTELRLELAEMTPEMRHLFRVGAAQALKAKIGDTVSRADATKKLLDIPALEDRINFAFGDQKLFSQYTKFLENEKDLFRAVTDVLGNSKTAERIAAQGDAALDPAILLEGASQVGRGSVVQGAVNLAKGAFRNLTDNPIESEAIARGLTGRSISGLENVSNISAITQQGAPKTIEETLIRALAPTLDR
jgi:hypothetical protein